ncbi:MAG TPA: hypothetical protein VFG52_03590, partial [Xanthomonadales bacterium]|nr:hypothetical protein [Xanthomonadales bacterium]
EASLETLEEMARFDAIPRLPWLLDLACFDAYASNPRYQAVVATIEARIAAVRERIPATLARHGLPPLAQWLPVEAASQP